MIQRLRWHVLARYYRARATRSQQDAERFAAEAEKYSSMLRGS